jgi:hypothetical protein
MPANNSKSTPSTTNDTSSSTPEALPSPQPIEPTAFAAILEGRRAMLAALPEKDVLRRIRLDPSVAFEIAMAGAEKVSAFRGALIAQFGDAVGPLLDDIRPAAAAAKQADVELHMSEDSTNLAALHREVMASYNLLITDANSLVNRGHLPPGSLDRVRNLVGYRPTVESLMGLVLVLRAHWDRIQGRGPITVADVDEGERVAYRMSEALSGREHGVLRAPAAETRVRALSDLVQKHDEVRRMMRFLRWKEDDADDIVPSLFIGRGRRASSDAVELPTNDPSGNDANDDATEDSKLPSPAEPSPNNGGPPFVS